MEDEEMVD
jgi:hypothetical protein